MVDGVAYRIQISQLACDGRQVDLVARTGPARELEAALSGAGAGLLAAGRREARRGTGVLVQDAAAASARRNADGGCAGVRVTVVDGRLGPRPTAGARRTLLHLRKGNILVGYERFPNRPVLAVLVHRAVEKHALASWSSFLIRLRRSHLLGARTTTRI